MKNRGKYTLGKIYAWIAYVLYHVLPLKNRTVKSAHERVLIVRLDAIGDLVMMSPSLRELRRAKPRADITLVVTPMTVGLFSSCPYVDRVLAYQPPKSRIGRLFRPFYAWRYCRHNICNGFDIAIVPRVSSDWGYGAGYLAFFSGATRRIGYSSGVDEEKKCLDAGFDRFYTELLPAPRHLHEVERNLNVLRYMGIEVKDNRLEFWISPDDEAFILRQWERKKDVFRIALFLSTSTDRKEWDVKFYAETLKRLEENHRVEVFLLGAGKHAADLACEMLRRYPQAIDLTDRLTLRQTGAFLRTSSLYLGGDTGPMHIADACHIPSVILFCHPEGADKTHVSSPERFGPWENKVIILRPKAFPGCEHGCEKDYAHCINNISVDEVVEAVETMLRKT